MKKITITVDSQPYQLVCDADQCDHLRQLADEVDRRARDIHQQTPHATASATLLLTCLTLADELFEAREETGRWREHVASTPATATASGPGPGPLLDADPTLQNLFDQLSRGVEDLLHVAGRP